MNGATLIAAVGVETVAALAVLHAGRTALGSTTPLTFAVSALAGAALFYALYGRRGSEGMRGVRPAALAVFALALAAASFSEEVLWRGLALRYLARSEGSALAVACSTLGFAGAHVVGQGWAGFRVHLLTGALFGIALVATGDLIDAIAAHAAYNLSLFVSVRDKGGSSYESVLTT